MYQKHGDGWHCQGDICGPDSTHETWKGRALGASDVCIAHEAKMQSRYQLRKIVQKINGGVHHKAV